MKKMKNKSCLLFIGIFFSISYTFISCKNEIKSKEIKSDVSEFNILLQYLEKNGDYVNSSKIPSNITAAAVFQNLNNNIQIIDIRDVESFNNGHIKGASNIRPDSLLSYFENVIEPNNFDTIVMVCDIGVRSAFVTGILRLLGYDNVFSMKFGMCAWNTRFADALWLNALSSKLEEKLETIENPKPEKEYHPEIHTGKSDSYEILRARAQALLSDTIKKFFVNIDDVSKDYSKYFIVKYLPENLNDIGQLKGAYQFSPRKSLSSKTDLFKIPTDKPVLVYCYTGTQSSFIVAFLKILGYNAYSLKYGANGFMYNTILKMLPEFAFTKENVNDFPVESSVSSASLNQQNVPIKVKVKGGC